MKVLEDVPRNLTRASGSRVAARSAWMASMGAFCAFLAVLLIGVTTAQANTQTFSYTGGEQTFTVPVNVTSVEVTAVGGHGGSAAASGGAAAEVTGTLAVTAGETLYVEVGGNGQNGNPDGRGLASGGFNGGAPGGAGGGGASDLRTSPRADGLSPEDRLIVAGGGGGSGQSGECQGGAGGAAEQEGEKGDGCGNDGGGPGSQKAGGAGGAGGCGPGQEGQLGIGGEGGGEGFEGVTCDLDTGGGGGGGLYGGGGGCGASLDSSGGGGGGSSLVPAGASSELAPPNAAPEIQITYVSSPPPVVVTEPASGVTSRAATLNATVNPEGSAVTTCTFEYGTTTSYGSSVPCSSLPGSGTSPVPVSAGISGLSPSTTYHFRIVAANGGAPAKGSDQSFATLPPQEELPEIGRCLKLKKPTGKYAEAGCTVKSAGEDSGSYEWAFEPGSARSFTFKNGAATLETVGGAKIKCLENTYGGEYTGSKAALVNLKLTGCEPTNRFGITCQSTGAHSGEVNFNILEGHLGYIENGSEPTVGMALTPTALEQPYVAQFHCGEVPVAITGGVIVPYSALNKMAATFTVPLKATKGVQTPEALEGGSPELLNMIIGEAASEQAGLKASDKVTNQESLEIKAS
jgi:hypothetical protein